MLYIYIAQMVDLEQLGKSGVKPKRNHLNANYSVFQPN